MDQTVLACVGNIQTYVGVAVARQDPPRPFGHLANEHQQAP